MSIIATTITPDLYQYVVEVSLRETELLQRLRQETLTLAGGQMMAAPEVSQLLALFTKLLRAQRIIEIGTFTGYTTLAIAMALTEQGKIISCDINPNSPMVGKKYWEEAGVQSKIELHIMPGLAVLDKLIAENQQNTFDLAFIDADKKNNYAYYEKLLTLLRPGGLLVIDNVLWSGRVLTSSNNDPKSQSIDQFNRLIKQDSRIELSMLPLGDGLTLALKR